MAIKDSIIDQVLKSEISAKSSQMLYKRLRETPGIKDEPNQIKPGLTESNPVKPGETGLNTIKSSQEDPVRPSFTGFNRVSTGTVSPIKPGLTQFKNLHGNPRRILEFLSISILDFQQLITKQLSLSKIAESVNLSRDSVKSALKYLIKNEIIKRIDFFAGIHGWAQYSIEKNAYISVKNMIQTGLNPVMQTGSNNSNSNNKITTIGEGWDEIDFSSLAHLGFEKTTLLQFKNCSTPEIVQTSIHYFSFEHKHENGKYKLPALISQLKKGEAWQRHPNYKTPQELTLERLRKEAQEAQRRAEKDVAELFELKFNEWFITLEQSDRKRKTISDLQQEFKQSKWQEIKKSWT